MRTEKGKATHEQSFPFRMFTDQQANKQTTTKCCIDGEEWISQSQALLVCVAISSMLVQHEVTTNVEMYLLCFFLSLSSFVRVSLFFFFLLLTASFSFSVSSSGVLFLRLHVLL